MHYKVSIIIPAFNVENHILRCLESVWNQDFDKNCYEIIVINDGSKDNTKTIIEEFIIDKNNIKLINQPNKGVTQARKLGVEKATGDYICFVDSDDTANRGLVSKLYNEAKITQADIVVSGINIIQNNTILKSIKYKEASMDSLLFLDLFLQRKYHWGPVSKLYRKELFDNTIFNIPRELSTGEDAVMNKNLLLNASKIIVINDILYNYYLHKNSTMSNRFKRREENRLYLFTQLMRENLTKEDLLYLQKTFLHYDIYNWIYYAKHGVSIKKLKEWKDNLYLQIKNTNPKFLTKRDKFLLKIFKYQWGINIYYYLSVIYRNLYKILK